MIKVDCLRVGGGGADLARRMLSGGSTGLCLLALCCTAAVGLDTGSGVFPRLCRPRVRYQVTLCRTTFIFPWNVVGNLVKGFLLFSVNHEWKICVKLYYFISITQGLDEMASQQRQQKYNNEKKLCVSGITPSNRN